jgi:hypothetical protein
MRTIRALLVFPFECLLITCIGVYVATELFCRLLGFVCRMIEGER